MRGLLFLATLLDCIGAARKETSAPAATASAPGEAPPTPPLDPCEYFPKTCEGEPAELWVWGQRGCSAASAMPQPIVGPKNGPSTRWFVDMTQVIHDEDPDLIGVALGNDLTVDLDTGEVWIGRPGNREFLDRREGGFVVDQISWGWRPSETPGHLAPAGQGIGIAGNDGPPSLVLFANAEQCTAWMSEHGPPSDTGYCELSFLKQRIVVPCEA